MAEIIFHCMYRFRIWTAYPSGTPEFTPGF